jgi:ribosome-associated protein
LRNDEVGRKGHFSYTICTQCMLVINEDITISEQEINIDQIRASGPGGQNVNKVASAVHLRFPIHESSLPERVKQRLLTLPDRRISSDGVVVIKAQQHRTLEQNRQDALRRLRLLIMSAVHEKKVRRPVKVSQAARRRRLEGKTKRSLLKQSRRKVTSLE